MSQISFSAESKSKYLLLPIGILCAVIGAWLTIQIGVGIPAAFIGIIGIVIYFIAVFKEPKIALVTCICYSFILWI